MPDLARSVNNLAIGLGEAGRRPEALVAAHEAVEAYRQLVANEDEVYGGRLDDAMTLVRTLTDDG